MFKPFTTRRGALAAAMALATITLLPGCGLGSDRLPDYRYRLTVEVDTPEGLRTGSSVIEVRTAIESDKAIPTPGAFRTQARGEAVAVDLGSRGVLFALLQSEASFDWAAGVMFGLTPQVARAEPFDVSDIHSVSGREKDRAISRQRIRDRFAAMLERRGLYELPVRFAGSRYIEGSPARPTLVRFGDIADPTTVAKVDPEDLAASFGTGVKLRRITVQLTDDPVTTGIEKRLAWIDHLEKYRKRPDNRFSSILPSEIGGLRRQ